jgi:DNA-binding NarL/FixJ family response regulator
VNVSNRTKSGGDSTILVKASLSAKLNIAQTVPISAIDPEQASILEANPLTNREMEVLELIVQGFSNQEIADQLYISLGSVKVYVRGVLNKLFASHRTQAAVIALRAGLFD